MTRSRSSNPNLDLLRQCCPALNGIIAGDLASGRALVNGQPITPPRASNCSRSSVAFKAGNEGPDHRRLNGQFQNSASAAKATIGNSPMTKMPLA